VVCTQNQCESNIQCRGPDGECRGDLKPIGTLCDDGSNTTKEDQCNMFGICKGMPKCTGVTCNDDPSSPDIQCRIQGSCIPTTGKCPIPDNTYSVSGTPCDDNNGTTVKDRCDSNGECRGVLESDSSGSTSSSGSDSSAGSDSSSEGAGMISGIVIGIVCLVLIAIGIAWHKRRKQQRQTGTSKTQNLIINRGFEDKNQCAVDTPHSKEWAASNHCSSHESNSQYNSRDLNEGNMQYEEPDSSQPMMYDQHGQQSPLYEPVEEHNSHSKGDKIGASQVEAKYELPSRMDNVADHYGFEPDHQYDSISNAPDSNADSDAPLKCDEYVNTSNAYSSPTYYVTKVEMAPNPDQKQISSKPYSSAVYYAIPNEESVEI